MFHKLLKLASPLVLAARVFLPWLGSNLALQAATDPPAWFQRALVGMEVGPTGAQFGGGRHASDYANRFDGAEIVRRSVAANAEYLVLWVRDGEFTFHESKLIPRPAGLGDRDVLREAVDEARKHRLPIIAYCQLQYPSHELRQHPEWKMRQANGKPIDHLVCFNSPYTNTVKALLTEMLGYGIAGFHLDMVDQGFGAPHGCWCDHCRKRFQAEHGRPLPKDIDWDSADWARMRQFRYASSDRFEKMLVDHVRQQAPQATVDFNYHGNPPFSWEVGQTPVRHADNGDFVTGEAGAWAFGALAGSFNAAWYRAATPGKPFQVAIQRGVRMYHDQTTRPLHDMRWEMFTLLAHGAFVTLIDKTAYDGSLDPVAWERMGAVLGEARSKRAHFGQPPLADVGLFFSSRTRDGIGRDKPAAWFQSIQGAHKACVYEHLSFGFLFDENLSLEGLRKFPVVCMPNVGILTDAEVDLLRKYVEGGGHLVITGHSGQFDELGKPLARPVLEGLIGARVKTRMEGTDHWVQLDATRLGEQLGQGLEHRTQKRPGTNVATAVPFLVRGPATAYERITAEPMGALLDSHRASLPNTGSYNADWPLSARQAMGPAALLHRVGQGTVLTLAASPDTATAGEHHIVEARRLFANAVRLLHPQPRVRVDAPANVEAIVTDDPATRTLRIHLIAYNATPQTTPVKDRPYIMPGLIEDKPIFRASFELRDALKTAKALNRSTQLKKRGNRVEVTIADIHDVIVCRY